MNLYKLRQMVVEGDMSVLTLRYLLECRGECEHLDFKEEIHLDNDYGQACFGRDVVAMKNTGGGYIVIGVRDKTWEPVGIKQPLLEDTKRIRDIVRKVTGLEIEADIVKYSIPVYGEQRDFAVVLIRASAKRTKRRTPSVCKVSFKQREDWGIRNGDIYIRRGDETVRINSDELEEIILDLEEQEDKSALEQQQIEPSPFMVEEGLYRILPPDYNSFISRGNLQKEIQDLVEGDLRIWIVNVYGPGGVGKSALVSWLAYHFYENRTFRAILHLSAKDTRLTETGIKSLRPTLFSLENLLESILHLFDLSIFINETLEEQKRLVQMLLSDYSTLLILDNMETVRDGRVMQFVRSLPPENKSKVLLTSRLRTSGWERPLQITELNLEETKQFIRRKSDEKKLGELKNFVHVAQSIHTSSGGLPLAVEWMLGQYALSGNMDTVINQVPSPNSPLLEFSFNTSWRALSKQSQTALAVLSIFDEAPTIRLWTTSLGWATETLENAISYLIEATFVYERIDDKTGQQTYHMLPITRAFARNKLADMGDIELTARTVYMRYLQQMELVAAEMQPFSSLFETFKVERDTEKQAIILARKAQSQSSSFNYDEAERLYKEAQAIDPRSVYVMVNYGLFKRDLGQIGEAVSLIEKAITYANKSNGFFIYYNLSQVYDVIKGRVKVEQYLRKALEYQPEHLIARHQLGVVISRLGKYDEGIKIFDELIEDELARESGPTDTLLYTYRTKIISLLKKKQTEKAKVVLTEAITELEKWPHLKNKIYQIKEVL